MPRPDPYGDAIAVARAKYGPRKPKPWGAALLTTLITFVIVGCMIAAMVMIR